MSLMPVQARPIVRPKPGTTATRAVDGADQSWLPKSWLFDFEDGADQSFDHWLLWPFEEGADQSYDYWMAWPFEDGADQSWNPMIWPFEG